MTAETLRPLSNPPRSQLEEWRKQKESHEQVAVGERVDRMSKKELSERLEREGRRSEGRRG